MFAFLEKDQRLLWIMMDSYKKSEANLKSLINHSDQAFFIVNLRRTVEYANTAARAFMKHTASRNILEIFPANTEDALNRLISAVSAGSKAAEEVFLRPLTLKFDPELLKTYAIRLEAKPISWKQSNCILLTVFDISLDKSKKILVYSRHKKAIDNLNGITREIERTYTEELPLRRVDLERQLKARIEFEKLGFLQMSMIGTVETSLVRFSPFDEGLRTTELLIEKAFEKKVEVCLTKEASIPQVVRGSLDAAGILLSSLLEFSLMEVVQAGQVQIYLEVSVSV